MTRWFALLLVLVFAATTLPELVTSTPAYAQVDDDKPKKRRKRRRKRRSKSKAAKKKVEAKAPEPPPPAEPTEEERRIAAEQARIEAANAKREAEGRKTSALEEGAASRWSNRGAMVPIVAEVPITAPIPSRNIPRAAGVETPGQKLFEGDEVVSARLSLSGMRLRTAGQDVRYFGEDRVDGDRDIELVRGRATLAYQHVAGTDFGIHLDMEYRPSFNVTRFTDQRVNELYVSYGLTDFRGFRTDLPFGVSVGRLAVREAGYAQADGVAFRLKVVDELHVGVFGGITGNPYGYNWALRTSEFISADWYTGGLFTSIRAGDLAVHLAGVATYANAAQNANGLDRFYASLDASYLVSSDLNFFASGMIDFLPSGQLIQNLELAGAYSPTQRTSVSLSVGRFSTVVYEQTTGYTFEFDPLGNRYTDQDPALRDRAIVDEQGVPIVPFDAAIYSTIYNQARLRGGYRVIRPVEIYGSVNALLRDFSGTEEALAAQGIVAEVEGTPFRMLPSVGARYRDPDVLDANVELTAVVDARSNTDAIVAAGLGRAIAGLYGSVDGRYYLGEINGLDGGVNLSYTLPRDWLPGMFLLRGTARYYRENLRLVMPVDDDADNNIILPKQETVLLLVGAEWRL